MSDDDRLDPRRAGAHGDPLVPRPPRGADEELLDADSPRIISEYDDDARVRRMGAEVAEGFEAMAHVGPAVSVFGSARTAPDDPQ